MYCATAKAVRPVQYRRFKRPNLKNKYLNQESKPMEFVSMDLIGEFHPPSSKGNRYALTAVCMLTGYTFCIPIKSKSAEEIATAWRNHIAFPVWCLQKTTDG